MNIKTFLKAVTLAAFVASPVYAQSNDQEIEPIENVGGKRISQLSCEVEGGWGLLLGSSKAATCQFERPDGSVEMYNGKLNKIGLDLGKTEEAYMTWAVFTRDDFVPGPADMIGSYSGISAEAALGIGLGAKALVGGNDRNIGLQPIALQGNTGLNVAVGLASLKLEAVSN